MRMEINFDGLKVKSTGTKLMFVPKKDNKSGFHFTLGAYHEKTLLDLHATLPIDAEKKAYTSISKVQISEIESAMDQMIDDFSNFGMQLRKLRLGWLRRNNYWVVTSKFLPRRWFEIQKSYDFSADGIKKYKDKISGFANRMIFDPEILWRLSLDQFSEVPLFLVNGSTGKYLQYKPYEWNGLRHLFAIAFKNQGGRKVSSQTAIFQAAGALMSMFENVKVKVDKANEDEEERKRTSLN